MVTAVVLQPRSSGPKEIVDPNYRRFTQLVAEDHKTEAMELGDSLFQALLKEKSDDSGLALLAKRLRTAWKIKSLLADKLLCDVAVHVGYLAKDGDAEQVAARTASILEDHRCRPHLAQILYLRWWALCKTNRSEETVQVAQRLLEQYPDNSCVAPVLLERAMDALAHQDYDKCRELFVRLTGDLISQARNPPGEPRTSSLVSGPAQGNEP